MKSVCCVVVCLALVALVDSKKLPGYVQVCKVTDPAYDACVLKSVEALRPRLAKGISKMRIPPLEPFALPGLEVNRDLDALTVRLRMKDIKAYGASNFRIDSIKSDPIKLTTTITVVLPTLAVEGEYDIDGRLLLVPLRGKGVFRGNFTNIKSEVSGKGKVETVNGVKKLSVAKMKTKIRLLGAADLKLVNRPDEPQNAAITETASNYFNQNQKPVLAIIYPILDETAEEIMVQIADSILQHLDYEELFPSK